MSRRALKRKRPKPKKQKLRKAVDNQEQAVVDEDIKEAGDEEQANGEEEQGNEEAALDNAAEAEEEQAAEEEGKEEEEEQLEAEGDEDGDEKPKLENFAPESVIFFDALRAETLTIDLTKLDTYEGMEDLRLYIERVDRKLFRTTGQITT
jgi:cobalamin biosynthesis protein CobT